MTEKRFIKDIFKQNKPIIGMIHLRPLPGSPLYDPANMSVSKITEIAINEALKLQNAGIDGLQIENIWDYPYLRGSDIGHETTTIMAVIASKIKESVDIPIGINCHLNGGMKALAIAAAVEAKWVRVFEWVNAYVSHAGILEGIGGKLSRYRSFLKAEDIKFFCDVNVKHGSHFIISDRTIADQARDAESEGAEALIVTGFETGKSPTSEKVKEFSRNVQVPVFLGSGTDIANVSALLKYADGAIVGSYFKEGNNWKRPVDGKKAEEFMKVVKKLREKLKND
ncbi:MAG TPA: BtpA/SgcQ family protein [Candidatus Atribacteria bacterium]|nr:BtpA/SgcQ family protein [Candidatus Atribacteria bacterium]